MTTRKELIERLKTERDEYRYQRDLWKAEAVHWNPVELSKPEMNQRVLVVIKNGNWRGVSIAEWTHMGWSCLTDDFYYKGVTHWDNLPGLPQDGE